MFIEMKKIPALTALNLKKIVQQIMKHNTENLKFGK